MNAFSIPGAPAWFNLLLNLSFQAALLAAIVWTVIKVFGRWIPPNWRALMWSLVILRSLIPFAPPSSFSVQNLFSKPGHPAAVKITVERSSPTIQFVQPTGSNVLYNPLSHTLPFEQPKAEMPQQPSGQPLAVAWSIGAIFFGGLLLARTLIIRRALLRTGVEPASAILNILSSCREAFGARYPVRVTASDQIASPALTGFLPARLIIPTTFTTDRYTPSQIRHILLHELAHIQQGHLILHWLGLIGRVVHWFNPAIHLAAAQMRQECELAADNAALKNSTPEERAAYGETILQVLSHSTAPPTLLALGMAEHARHLKRRLSALANPHQRHFRTLGFAFVGVLMLTGLTSAIEKQESAPATITEAELKKMREQMRPRYSVRNKNAISSDHLEDLQNEPPRNFTPIEKAKVLIGQGRRREAENLLKQALEENPNDVAARFYLELIEEHYRTILGGGPTQAQRDQLNNQGPQGQKALERLERSWNKSVARADLPSPNPFARTNTVNTSPSRQKLYRKLETLRIDDFPLQEETSLVEVLRRLGNEFRRRDPDGRGVNLIISKASSQNTTGATAIDPLTGLTIEPEKTELDPEDFKVKFDPPIRDVTLGQFLDAIVMVAQPPAQPPPSTARLRYSVEDYAIVFSVVQKEPVAMYSRTFRLNPNTFRQGFEAVTDSTNAGNAPQAGNSGRTFVTTVTNLSPAQIQLRAFLAAAGVDFPTNNVAVGNGAVPADFGVSSPGAPQQNAIFFNERTGVLMVRAPLQDLNTIENALHTLNTQGSPAAKPTEELVTRSYKLDREQFKKQLEGVRPRVVGTQLHDISVQVHAFAELVGLNFSTNRPWSWPDEKSRKAIFYNDTTGHLFVRATAQELDRLERAIANPKLVPPQVSISIQAYEVPGEQVAWIKTNFAAGRVITATNEYVIASTNAANPPAPLLEQTKHILGLMKNAQIATNLAQASEFIISQSGLKSVLKQVEGVKGVDGMVAPNLTTIIGRQARISIEETKTIVTPSGTNFIEVYIPLGWVFDCFPESLDGTDVQIKIGAAYTKFLGYENERNAPAPRLHVEATGSRAKIPVGSSQMFLVPIPTRKDPALEELPLKGRLFRYEEVPRHFLILITPTIIDAAGNAVFPQQK
jgi:beta-lactamase regulating signal transducer with metallopeptidase domain